jgi:hypothetical protein
MGKFARTVFLSLLFAAVLVIGVVTTGYGAEAWAFVRPLFLPLAGYFKLTLP